MQQTPDTRDENAGEPEIDTHREVRLALVMYGGVSLAIYMNGVSQELYHLVRATAPKSLRPRESTDPLVPLSQLTGTEAVYRKLGQALEDLATTPDAPVATVKPSNNITTRFVIDILSGTSAGGINAVFLGKALANNQSIEQLQKLWEEQGDISVLLNDRRSQVPGLTPEHPAESLLNSGRMYNRLLVAFDSMEGTESPDGPAVAAGDSIECRSPYVRELDLWVTTTDLRGVTLPLKIANGLAYERRYRNVFHFVYGTAEASGGDRNDFLGKNNPMLAFAARCTSAFPFAFKPMLFEDIGESLALVDEYRTTDLTTHPWQSFYASYFPPPDDSAVGYLEPERQLPFNKRPFADGGALDNKPFTWATDTVTRRRADVPVDRKLIYIEPDPGHPEASKTKQERPNVVQNFQLQGVSLPRQETIRQDLQAVLDRNRTIGRVDRVLRGLATEVFPALRVKAPEDAPSRQPGTDWARLDIRAGLETYGRAYGGYHRLKAATVSDDLSSLIASVAGFDEDSDELLAIRYLVRQWRDDHYSHYAEEGKPETFNAFLVAFDLDHRLRRLTFLRSRADALYPLNEDTRKVLGELGIEVPDLSVHGEFRTSFQDELRRLKTSISEIFMKLRLLGRVLRSHGRSPLKVDLGNLRIGRTELYSIIKVLGETARIERAGELYQERKAEFERFSGHLAALIEHGIPVPGDPPIPDGASEPYGTSGASADLKSGLADRPGADPAAAAARTVIRAYSDCFDDFDMVAFPMLYGTDAGEADPVEIIRIAPEDATSIIDERKSEFMVRKTRGWKYSHFGAFLDADWRKNDIMFGRLDAAECLIKTFVPAGNSQRDELLQDAQKAIILESLSADQKRTILGADDASRLEPAEVVKRFKENYRVTEDLAPGLVLPIAARGVDVTGKVLKGASEGKGALKTPIGWLARIGSWLAAIVEVAMPGSTPGMLFSHLWALLVLFEAVMIGLGWFFRSSTLRSIGIKALALTLLAGAVVYIVRMVLRKSGGGRPRVRVVKRLRFALVGVIVVAVLGAAAAGIGRDWNHPGRYWQDIKAFYHHLRSTPPPSTRK